MELRNVTFGYRKNKPVLHDVSLKLQPGITILLGENGSGKTTLIKNLLGLVRPSSGTILTGEERIRYLPQDFSIYPSLTVQDILRFAAEQSGLAGKERDFAVADAGRRTHITEVLGKRFGACSIGTQKRVGIAATLLGAPTLAVLDEPTAGIDPRERMAFYEIVQEAFNGKSVLLSTHILDDLDSLADHVLMLWQGRVVFDGSYTAYKTALDGRLYELHTAAVPTWLPQTQIVSSRKAEGGLQLRFVSETTPPEGVPCQANTADIWTWLSEHHA